jgi:FecR protein
MGSIRFVSLVAATLTLAVLTASAQPVISAKSGVIAGLEGKVYLDNQLQESSVTHFPDMKENSVLRTEEGRAEVLLPPGYVLRIGENSSFKMLTTRLIDTRLEITAGSGIVEVDENSKDTNVAITLKGGTATLPKTGVYRFDSEPAQIKVFSGTASVLLGENTILVPAGHMLSLAGGPAVVEKFDILATDALDHWARRRAEAMAVANVSAAKYVNDNYGKLNHSSWGFNPYFGVYTYIPMDGRMCNSYYGYCYYSPSVVYTSFYAPVMTYNPSDFGGANSATNYSNMGATNTAVSSTVAAAPSMSSAPAASAASTASSAAASSSAGHGSAASGGHGK